MLPDAAHRPVEAVTRQLVSPSDGANQATSSKRSRSSTSRLAAQVTRSSMERPQSFDGPTEYHSTGTPNRSASISAASSGRG